MGDYIYVDNSNVFIEGQRVSAADQGMALNIYDAMQNRVIDTGYRMDFGKLHKFVAGDDPSTIRRAMLFGSRPPANDELWKLAEREGFEVVVEDRNFANREKKIDTGIVAALMRDAYRNAQEGDVFKIVAGDADYIPAVEQLVKDGFKVDVVFWDHASKDLKTACTKFVSLNPMLRMLSS